MPRRKRTDRTPYDPAAVFNRPLAAPTGIRARSQRGNFARSWWGGRWIAAMEALVDPGRLSRGRIYARRGQVLSLDEVRNGIEARVQGSLPRPYHVRIQVRPLSDPEWEKVLDRMSGQALFAAQLLAGEMPQDIEKAFDLAGVSLFPKKSGDLRTDCSCPDWANPCKHVAAAHFLLAERFDDDPFLIFRLRGRTQEQILNGLHSRRGGNGHAVSSEGAALPEPPAPDLEDEMQHFWTLRKPLEGLSFSLRASPVEMPVLRRLGEPAFMGNESLRDLLAEVYREVTRQSGL